MRERVAREWALVATLAIMVAACEREAPRTTAGPSAEAARPAVSSPAAPANVLEDVVEAKPGYVVGISYPKGVTKYPGLAAELQRYAATVRAGLDEALTERKPAPDAPMYDLTLTFGILAETPALVAVAADGSRYTGGAHAEPLIARFVWLPQENRLLTAAELVPDARGWSAIADIVRRQLHDALAQRLQADGTPPEDRAEIARAARGMIEDGTKPEARQFANFEPVMTPQGTIGALRFVFPPYQVGSYADGTQSVEVPAELLLPHVAPQYRRLFAGGAG
jgi:hypothetical protein